MVHELFDYDDSQSVVLRMIYGERNQPGVTDHGIQYNKDQSRYFAWNSLV